MKLEQAKIIAEKYLDLLKPYCLRIEIAGSIRREKSEVGDIELVVIPNPRHLINFCNQVNEWKKVKGEPTGRYTQRILPEKIKLDLFITCAECWGLIFAIRTGSAEFSHKVLANGWVKAGYKSKDGILWKDNVPTYIREEEELFNLIKVNYLEPKFRI